MADEEDPVVELDDLLVRPGTYFNPQTEVVVVVIDDASIDQEIFNMEAYEGADWVRIADDTPVDGDGLDTLLQRFQTQHVDIEALAPSEEDLALGADEDVDDDPDPEETAVIESADGPPGEEE